MDQNALVMQEVVTVQALLRHALDKAVHAMVITV